MAGNGDDQHLDRHREAIDRIDTQLLALLNERAEHAMGIGEIKKRRNAPIYVPEREQAVLDRLLAANRGPLPDDSIRLLFECVFGEMKRLESEPGSPPPR